jgi:hypothetical protein
VKAPRSFISRINAPVQGTPGRIKSGPRQRRVVDSVARRDVASHISKERRTAAHARVQGLVSVDDPFLQVAFAQQLGELLVRQNRRSRQAR